MIGSSEMEPSPFKMVLSPTLIFDQARASPKSPKITGPIEGGIDLAPPIAVTLPNIVEWQKKRALEQLLGGSGAFAVAPLLLCYVL